jgi:hypothetical protein
MTKVNANNDTELGTVTFKSNYECIVFGDRFEAGQTVTVGKAMLTPFGEAYYKVLGSKVWVTSKEVTNINVKMGQRRTYRSVL